MGERSKRKTVIGKVVSTKMDKTIMVSIESKYQHPLYNKYLKKTSKFMAHDEKNECSEGDKVLIAEIRPLSKHKRWRLVEILEKVR